MGRMTAKRRREIDGMKEMTICEYCSHQGEPMCDECPLKPKEVEEKKDAKNSYPRS